MRTTIIVPTYNERENISKMVPAIFAVLPDVNVLVVDDNSPDKTYEVVREMQKSMPNLSLLLRKKKAGLGKAYIHAFQTILEDGESDAVIMMDADFSHNPKYLKDMLLAAKNNDVVIGSRYVEGGGLKDWDLSRKLLSSFANMYARTILHIPIKDCTAGFIFMRTDFLQRLNLDMINSAGYAFLIELKSLLLKTDARIKEIPMIIDDRTVGKSKMSWKIVWEGVLAPWKIRKDFSKKSKSVKQTYFFESDFSQLQNKYIFLDIDGTLINDGGTDIDEKTLSKLKHLSRDNTVVFCSNKRKCESRNRLFVSISNIPCLSTPHKKPSKKILQFVKNESDLSFVVIGDKFLTDYLFARKIGALFIRVRRIKGVSDSFFTKTIYLIDDMAFALDRVWNI